MNKYDSQSKLTKSQIFDIIQNDRRRKVLMHLKQNVGYLTVRTLAESIAEAETGQSPPPRSTRQSVYNSLIQTHLPKLDSLNFVDYDSGRKTVELKSTARQADLYLEMNTPHGITWAEYYQILMLLLLLTMLFEEIGVPIVSAIPEIVWLIGFFVVGGSSAAWRLWSHRWIYLKGIF